MKKVDKTKWVRKKRVIEEATVFEDEYQKRIDSIMEAPRGVDERVRAMLP